jgi:hypothetical protein
VCIDVLVPCFFYKDFPDVTDICYVKYFHCFP